MKPIINLPSNIFKGTDQWRELELQIYIFMQKQIKETKND